MNVPLLIFTHMAAAAAGGALVYFLALRAAGESPHLPHITGGEHMHGNSEVEQAESRTRWQRLRHWLSSHREPPTWLIIVIASAVVIAIGVQAALVQADNRARDRRDGARQACLNAFAADLVQTLSAVREANLKVADAQESKDDALDDVFVLLLANNRQPPTTSREQAIARDQFAAAVAKRVAAQRDLDRAKREYAVTQAQNPYVPPKTPKAVC